MDKQLYSALIDTYRARQERNVRIAQKRKEEVFAAHPDVEDLHLEEPKIVKQMGGYGVRLRASAKSIHMIRANIETELSPTVGTEAETEELVKDLLARFDENPAEIWHSKLFGKTLYDLVGEGLHAKLAHMPEESRTKLSETLERIINEGAGGLICILL